MQKYYLKQLLVVVFMLLCGTYMCAQSFEIDGIYYKIHDSPRFTVTVDSCSKYYVGELIIPSTVNYKNNSYSVEYIGWYAFQGCNRLTSVTIPNSVFAIEESAFEGCSSLKSVIIPNSVIIIGFNAFRLCDSLTSVTIPNSVTNIHSDAFAYCTSLTSVTIPNSVTYIGDYAFYGCTSLKSVTIGSGIERMATSAFRECKNIEYISLNYSEIDSEFSDITSLKKVEFGDSVTSIKEMAFRGCTGIESITFGRGLKKIKNNAFWDCVNLKTTVNFSNLYLQLGNNRTINAPNGFLDGDFIFGDVEGIKTLCGYIGSDTIIVLPENCKGENYVIKELLFADNYNIASVTIPNSVTNIGDRAFWACDRLKNVTMGNGVTNIGESAFYNCSSLTNVTIGNSVTSIGDYAFDGCIGLTSVTIPNSVTSIERGAFDGCIGLTSVTIPNNVTSIERGAFDGCTGLISITVEENNSVYDSRNNCNAIIETATNTLVKGCNTTNIPNGITSIEEYAFDHCTGLTNVTIPNSVTSIERGAFDGCTGLISITVEENNSVYDSRNNCNAIIETATNTLVKGCNTTVIPNGVTNIGDHALSGCSSLTSVTIPNGVTSIGHGAFSNCSSLTSVTIGNSVTNIGMAAFTDCHSLKSVYLLSETPPAINYSFIGIYEKTTVHVPNGALAAYKAVEEWNYFANIVEFDPTGIEATEEDAPAFEVTSNGIQFTASQGKAVAVYTIGGALIESTDSYAGEEITLEKGVYVVKIGNKIIKVKL